MATLLLGLSGLIGSQAGARGVVTGVRASVSSVPVGTAVTVSVTGSNPCGGAFLNYGDGTALTYAITGLPTSHTHTYTAPGAYTIIARGMGNCDGEVTTKLDVTGAPPAPPPKGPAITNVTLAPSPAAVRQPVTITIAGQGPCAITVGFGDGNRQELSGPLPRTVKHTYAVAKTYTVIVAPAAPCTGKFTNVLQVAPRGGLRISGLTLDPSPADAGRAVSIVVDGVGTCPYHIDYGDDNGEDREKPLPDRLQHVYNAPGTYTVAVAAGAGCDGRQQRQLDVR